MINQLLQTTKNQTKLKQSSHLHAGLLDPQVECSPPWWIFMIRPSFVKQWKLIKSHLWGNHARISVLLSAFTPSPQIPPLAWNWWYNKWRKVFGLEFIYPRVFARVKILHSENHFWVLRAKGRSDLITLVISQFQKANVVTLITGHVGFWGLLWDLVCPKLLSGLPSRTNRLWRAGGKGFFGTKKYLWNPLGEGSEQWG